MRVRNTPSAAVLLSALLAVSAPLLLNSCGAAEVSADDGGGMAGDMVLVPAGSFVRDGNSSNVSRVRAFYIGRREVTYGLFERVMGIEGALARSYSTGSGDSPATYVNWYDAITFCNKLSLAEGLDPVYSVAGINFAALAYGDNPYTRRYEVLDGAWDFPAVDPDANGYRLPTETEWEWAAMGADSGDPGRLNVSGYLKPFSGSDGSNRIGDFAVFGWGGSESGRTTFERSSPTGSKSANELGLLDMSGNAAEWCFDWYGESLPGGTLAEGYSGTADPYGEATFLCRVVRGGSWYADSSYAAPASRSSFLAPYSGGVTVGFRLARSR